MKEKTLSIINFTMRRAITISLIGGVLLTGLSTLAHVNRNWELDENFHILFSFISNTLIFFLILCFNFAIIRGSLTTRKKYIISIVGSLVIAAGLSTLFNAVRLMLYDDLSHLDPNSINLMRDMGFALIATLVALLIFSLTRRMQIHLEKEQLESENLMVRYEALENQMNPHFLFNSLNTLGGLIGTDDERALRYLQELSSTYRYIMQAKRLVTLEAELAFVSSYSQMMQIRYGKNLHIDLHIDNTYQHHYIVPISIQLLLENALKHNVISDRHPLHIRIETTAEATIRVSNPIRPKQGSESTSGMGLANLAKRYQLLQQRDIKITNNNNQFIVEVPLLDPQTGAKILSQLDDKINRKL